MATVALTAVATASSAGWGHLPVALDGWVGRPIVEPFALVIKLPPSDWWHQLVFLPRHLGPQPPCLLSQLLPNPPVVTDSDKERVHCVSQYVSTNYMMFSRLIQYVKNCTQCDKCLHRYAVNVPPVKKVLLVASPILLTIDRALPADPTTVRQELIEAKARHFSRPSIAPQLNHAW